MKCKTLIFLIPLFLIGINCTKNNAPTSNLPSFTLVDNSNKNISFDEFAKDNVVFVNFWATWCGPCVEETPHIVELYHEFKGKNVKFLSISVDEGADAQLLVDEFKIKNNIPFTIILDKDQSIQKAFGGMRGIPTTFVIDKSGKIIEKILGSRSKQDFAQIINKALSN